MKNRKPNHKHGFYADNSNRNISAINKHWCGQTIYGFKSPSLQGPKPLAGITADRPPFDKGLGFKLIWYMKIILFHILLISVTFSFGQDNIQLNKETSKKITGKWRGQKIKEYNAKNKLKTKRYRDTLSLNSDSTYFWAFIDEKEGGKWKIETYSDARQMLVLNTNEGKSNGGVYIYQLTENTLILRTYSLVGECADCNNSVDFFFLRVK